jgi:hypothetical protein
MNRRGQALFLSQNLEELKVAFLDSGKNEPVQIVGACSRIRSS